MINFYNEDCLKAMMEMPGFGHTANTERKEWEK